MCGAGKYEWSVLEQIRTPFCSLNSNCSQSSICSPNANALPNASLQPKRQLAAQRQFAAQTPISSRFPVCSPNANLQSYNANLKAFSQPKRISAAQTHVSQRYCPANTAGLAVKEACDARPCKVRRACWQGRNRFVAPQKTQGLLSGKHTMWP